MHSYMLSEFDKVIPMNYFRSTRTLDRGSSFFFPAAFQITYYYLTIELFRQV